MSINNPYDENDQYNQPQKKPIEALIRTQQSIRVVAWAILRGAYHRIYPIVSSIFGLKNPPNNDK